MRKYIKQYKQSLQENIEDLPITEEVLRTPTYKKRQGKRRDLTEEIKTRLRGFIKENKWKQEHYMSKQQMKMTDMHENLLDEGHIIGYTTVRNFINSETSKVRGVFIRKHAEAGY